VSVARAKAAATKAHTPALLLMLRFRVKWSRDYRSGQPERIFGVCRWSVGVEGVDAERGGVGKGKTEGVEVAARRRKALNRAPSGFVW